MVFLRGVAIGLFLVFISGCATVKKEDVVVSQYQKESLWQNHQKMLLEIKLWQLSGRLGLKVPDRSGSMSIEWRQDQETYSIYLDGPFGQSLAKIKGSEKGVTAQLSDETLYGPTPEYLMQRLTGWDFPLTHLKYWVRALPVPDEEAVVELNNLGYPGLIQQKGWEIRYLQYSQVGHLQMPLRLRVSQGNIRMNLVVTHWQLP